MDFAFKLKGLELTATEAKSLLDAADQKASFVIDLEQHVDARILSAPDLFALSIEKKDPTLAALASRLAFSKPEIKAIKKPQLAVKTPSVLRLIKKVEKTDLIQECLEHPSYKTVGAAMILAAIDNKEFRALRDVACHWVNTYWNDEKYPEKSLLFKGFKNDPQNIRKLLPIENKQGFVRSDTYYVSPTYLSVTAGLKLLQQHGLVTTEIRWSLGSRRDVSDPRAKSTRRKYFVFKLTEAGMQIKDEWGDTEFYISNFWRTRVSEKSA